MSSLKDKQALPKLLREAIVQLCRVGVGSHGTFNIDGIICIENVTADNTEVVVKIHENICSGNLQVNQNSNNIGNTFPCSVTSAHQQRIHSQHFESYDSIGASSVGAMLQTSNAGHYDQVMASQQVQQVSQNKQDDSALHDSDCEILHDSTYKLFGSDIASICGEDFGGMCDESSVLQLIDDMSIKPDPARAKHQNVVSVVNEKHMGDSSDEEVKFEKLTAGRARKPHRTRNSYKDVNGASVQVLSNEEYARTLKSEKLKRGRDRSPEFISSKRMVRATNDLASYNTQPTASVQVFGVSNTAPAVSFLNVNSITSSAKALPSVISTTANSAPSSSISIRSHHVGKEVPTGVTNNFPSVLQRTLNTQTNLVGNATSTDIKYTSLQGKILGTAVVTKTAAQSVQLMEQQNAELSSHNDTSQTVAIDFVKELNSSSEQSGGVPIASTQGKRKISKHTRKRADKKASEAQAIIASALKTARGSVAPTSQKSVVCLNDVSQLTESKPHQCPSCRVVCATFKQLDYHMYTQHQGGCMCPLCGKLFKQRPTRNRHIVAVHSQAKNFACGLCESTFTRIDSIKKHYSTKHPHETMPKCPYSYVKGAATSKQLQDRDQSQDIDDTDMKYIEENLMSVSNITTAADDGSDVYVQDVVPTNMIIANAANIARIESDAHDGSGRNVIYVNDPNITPMMFDASQIRLEPVTSDVVLQDIQSSNPYTVADSSNSASLMPSQVAVASTVDTCTASDTIKTTSSSAALDCQRSLLPSATTYESTVSNSGGTVVELQYEDENSTASVDFALHEEYSSNSNDPVCGDAGNGGGEAGSGCSEAGSGCSDAGSACSEAGSTSSELMSFTKQTDITHKPVLVNDDSHNITTFPQHESRSQDRIVSHVSTVQTQAEAPTITRDSATTDTFSTSIAGVSSLSASQSLPVVKSIVTNTVFEAPAVQSASTNSNNAPQSPVVQPLTGQITSLTQLLRHAIAGTQITGTTMVVPQQVAISRSSVSRQSSQPSHNVSCTNVVDDNMSGEKDQDGVSMIEISDDDTLS